MLVDPVAHVGTADPGRPPGLGLVFAAPGKRNVPVVVDVVIIEDHRGRDDRQQPSHRRLAPGLAVEEAVLSEVRDLVTRRARRVPARLDELAGGRAHLIGIDLVADQEHDIGPAFAGRLTQVQGIGGQRVRPMLLLMPGASPAASLDRQFGDPAGTEDELQRPVRVQRPERARRELRTRLGPADDAVQGDLILVLGSRPEAVDHHQPVVVPGHLEGLRVVTEDLDLAGPVGLDPYRDRGLADVAQQWAEHEQGSFRIAIFHAALVPRIRLQPHSPAVPGRDRAQGHPRIAGPRGITRMKRFNTRF